MRRVALFLVPVITLVIVALLILAVKGPLESCYCLGEWNWEAALAAPWRIAVVEVDGVPREALQSLEAEAVLGYVNAGYAEEWRGYWSELEGSEIILGPSEYEGEWLVAFWSDEWRRILLSEALRVAAAGVDGVYLDNVDAYEYVEPPEGVDAAGEMAELVCWLAEKIKEEHPNAVIAVNIGGGYELLESPYNIGSCIDVVYREELWSVWSNEHPEPQSPEETLSALSALEKTASSGVEVVIVDPVEGELDALNLCIEAAIHGFSAVPQPHWDPDYTAPPPWRLCSAINKVAALLNP